MPKIFRRSVLLYFYMVMLSGCLSGAPTPSKTLAATAILPDMQAPLPPFLRDVYPEPGSQVTQTAYTTGIGDDENRLFDQFSGAVCVDLNLEGLLEQKDHNLDSNDYVGRGYLEVETLGSNTHGIPVRRDRVWTSEAGGALFDERGNSIGGSLIACWEVDLIPNVYGATYKYTQSSGYVLSYTWSFEITE
jgi:hypothetical protein